MEQLLDWMAANPQVRAWFTTAAHFLFPVLALLILIWTIRSLLTVPCLLGAWAYLTPPNGAQESLVHWENILDRGGNSDVILNYPVVSRQYAVLIRQADDIWATYDLGSRGGATINGRPVEGSAPVRYGDMVGIGGTEAVLLPLSPEEKTQHRQRRRVMWPALPWLGLMLLTVFQALTTPQLIISKGKNAMVMIPLTSLPLTGAMWLYFPTFRALRRVGSETEIIAFFLSTLSLTMTFSSNTPALFEQFLHVVLRLALLLALGVFLCNLGWAKKIRWFMATGAIGLLSLTVTLCPLGLTGTKYGAANWLTIAGISVQPSGLTKICYILTGAVTLDRLFRKRNLGLFVLLAGACLACLAYASDLGTAAISFITFLIIAYLHSGDWAILVLICGGGMFAVFTMLPLEPYVLQRFATQGHAWQNASVGSGYQQTRTTSATAPGGLVGVGPGKDWLHTVGTGDIDLVFGMLYGKWGLIIALLAAPSTLALAMFAVRAYWAGRSSFYVIAVCTATPTMTFQTCLSVFGAVGIPPFTGVTFPFASNGDTAIITSQGLLIFLKVADIRQNVNLAIRLPSWREDRREVALAPKSIDGWDADDEED